MMQREQEQRARIDMIQAIVRSQTALARMLEQIADVADHSEASVKRLKDNIRLLSDYQLALCGMITGWRSRQLTLGTPTSPWLHPACKLQRTITRGAQEDESIEKGQTSTTDPERGQTPQDSTAGKKSIAAGRKRPPSLAPVASSPDAAISAAT
ncbi:hypothetical protein [Paenibacillus apiarius]|uniref:Uncharacterized protein n=1 Tax=Paenibacillus apiarius TaxID=46240 RepID=A0ABT4E2J3_9BACL|nr:hypothetical protein [Paenibacillus apiarius]MCY9516460.1 hypothetical protein [Paenibacillus apiarius]MCY9522451.1 hypothetical protein [Paenibacillus apiarius]MCY9554625.1 hypothetical protein [Paenibacillus apiarius]MCY9556741.1 hypothetical protein [Paenibacillus apiarius]MCY9686578.1 hypothetical protein [Paenibacillus apiarius]